MWSIEAVDRLFGFQRVTCGVKSHVVDRNDVIFYPEAEVVILERLCVTAAVRRPPTGGAPARRDAKGIYPVVYFITMIND